MATFEDAGYFCIDNLPPQMLPNVVQLFALEGNPVNRVALVFDARGGTLLRRAGPGARLPARLGHRLFRVLYLEADDEALVARYQATPAAASAVAQSARGHRAGAATAGSPLRATGRHRDRHHATSRPGGLRRRLEETLLADRSERSAATSAWSPSAIATGCPDEADMVLDARFLPNPHWVPDLRPLSGLDPAVQEYVLGAPEAAGLPRPGGRPGAASWRRVSWPSRSGGWCWPWAAPVGGTGRWP